MASSNTSVKRVIPGMTGLYCVNCETWGAEGRIDKRGRPFLGCERCAARFFGLAPRSVHTVTALLDLMRQPQILEHVLAEAAKTWGAATKPPQKPSAAAEAIGQALEKSA